MKTEKDPSRAARAQFLLGITIIFVTATPDAMVVPVLRDLVIERYGAPISAAHLFMTINLLGALAAVMLMRTLQRRASHARVVRIAALSNAALLALMALPIGLLPTLAVRFLEGAADLVVYAFVFSSLARSAPAPGKGARMGAAGCALMLGVAGGLAIGALIAQPWPPNVLLAGAAACAIGALLASGVRTPPGDAAPAYTQAREQQTARRTTLTPILPMMFADRAASGLLVTTVPLYLAARGLSPHAAGGMIGLAMLLMALGACPAGRLADRVNPLRLRLYASIIYAACLASIVLTPPLTTILTPALAGTGLAGAVLFTSSLTLVARTETGAPGMGALHAAGNLGFFVGPTAAGLALALFAGPDPAADAFVPVVVIASLAYLTLALSPLAWARLARQSDLLGTPSPVIPR